LWYASRVGLKLRLNLFDVVDAPDIFGALAEFYGKRGAELVAEEDDTRRYDLYHRQERWCVLGWDGGWEWKQRRDAQLFVSGRLSITGMLVFAYDGEYWGYELFRNGEVLDQFVQMPGSSATWFPNRVCTGESSVLARTLGSEESDLAPYLVQKPDYGEPNADETRRRLNVRARPNDEFSRFEECAVLDFLRAVGLGIELKDGYARIRSELWRSFRPQYD
jgi:hypothetical protein